MIRPASEIEFPPSEAARARAAMIVRMEDLNRSSRTLVSVIAERLGQAETPAQSPFGALTAEQERLIGNMRSLLRMR